MMDDRSNAPIRLIVVDDHPLFREGVDSLIARTDDIDLVGQGATGHDAIRLARELSPDIVLMDLHMPALDGIAATRSIVASHPDAKVIVLTMLDDDESVLAAIRAGARGYVLKGSERGSLLRAVRAVARGEALLGEAVAKRVLDHLATGSVPPAVATTEPQTGPDATGAAPAGDPTAFDPDIARLTPREQEVLGLIATGLRNHDIATRLFISERTVGNHITSIFRKLHIADRAQAVIRGRRAALHGADMPPSRPATEAGAGSPAGRQPPSASEGASNPSRTNRADGESRLPRPGSR
jgi:DNA-binding NarL/FixJ family response regulator